MKVCETFSFDPLTHTYRTLPDGLVRPSVSAVLQSAGLCDDLSRIPPHILERKRFIGEQVHKACHALDDGELDWNSLDDSILPYVLGYQRFTEEHDYQPLWIERISIAEVCGYKYGMTLDRIARLDGKLVLIDLKTASQKQRWHALQTAAYWLGTETLSGAEEMARMALWLRPNGAAEQLWHGDIADMEIFRAALQVTYWKEGQK